jgi:four helix bundle protein
MKQNVLLEKTFEFAVESVKIARKIQEKHKEYIVSRQFLKAATSIGANSEEAVAAHSTADFIAKLTISQKEARETKYWLRLIHASELYDSSVQLKAIDEISRIIASIILTTKQRSETPVKPIHNS